MRRVFVALALTAVAGLVTLAADADDDQIARQIIQQLQREKEAGNLRGFDMQLKVDGGTAWIKGRVTTPQQQALVLQVAQRTPGVKQVVNDLALAESGAARSAQGLAMPQPPSPNQPQAIAQSESGEQRSSRRAPSRYEEETPAPQSNAPAQIAQAPAYPRTDGRPVMEERPQPPQPIAAAGPAQPMMVPTFASTRTTAPEAPLGVDVQRKSMLTQARPVSTSVAQTGATQPDSQSAAGQSTGPVAPAAATGAPQAGAQQAWGPAHYPGAMYYPPHGAYHPGAYHPGANQTPLAFAPAGYGAHPGQHPVQPAGYDPGHGGPIPTHVPGVAAGVRPARYDHPHMPGYSWPSYASYPNYAAVTYPKQYSPSAWPYIGPFYPYPQVPLGWRHVTLEWDDGWWMLDFKDRRRKFP